MADEQRPTRATHPEDDARQIPWKLVLWGAVALYAIVFLFANSSKQRVSFVFFSVQTRLIWLILLSMALGVVLGRIGPGWLRRRREK